MDDDGGEEGEGGFEVVVDPHGDDFAGGVGEAGDVVEVVVVELFDEGFDGFFDVAVVDEVAFGGIDGAGDDDVEAEGMAVEAAAFMAVGEGGEVVGGLEVEGFGQANVHCGCSK